MTRDEAISDGVESLYAWRVPGETVEVFADATVPGVVPADLTDAIGYVDETVFGDKDDEGYPWPEAVKRMTAMSEDWTAVNRITGTVDRLRDMVEEYGKTHLGIGAETGKVTYLKKAPKKPSK